MTSSLASPGPNISALSTQRTDPGALDHAVAALHDRKDRWAQLDLPRRVRYLRAAIAGTARVAGRQAATAARAQGVAPGSTAAAESLIGGPYVQIRTMRLLAQTLEALAEGDRSLPKSRLRTRDNGRLAVRVFPDEALDRLLYAGFRAEVWMQNGVTAENLDAHRASAYRARGRSGRVALVLGAGNVASIGPLDAVYKLFAENQVVLLKLNPVNDYLGPFIEEAFADLIDDGFLATVYGGSETGAYLCEHEGIDEIHITGSARTHDLIVFGPGAEGEAARAAGRPRLNKRITSELGNVSPIVVVPGAWSERDLRFHAENIATQMTQNGGFNCNATKVIVTHAEWPQRTALLDRLEKTLSSLPPRPAYYPGAADRFDRFVDHYPEARLCGVRDSGSLPAALIRSLAPDTERDLVFREESFCTVTAETPLSAPDTPTFLDRAVRFANDRLYGTLNAGLIAAPATRSEYGAAIDRAVEELRYGSVVLNHWPALAYGLGSTTWGAFPGHTLEEIQSGIGVVHNALLFDRPEKSVVEGPFHVSPKPAWFATHKNAYAVAERLVELEANPSLLRLPRLFLNALFG